MTLKKASEVTTYRPHNLTKKNTRRQLIYPTDFQVCGTTIAIHRSYKTWK